MVSLKSSIFISGGSGLLAVNWLYEKRDKYSIFLGLNERRICPKGEINLIYQYFKNEEILVDQLRSINPDVVIHTAGLTNVEKCEANPDLAFKVNVDLSIIIAKATYKLGIPLVYISTDHLFEGYNSMVSENEPTNATNFYGQSKAVAEKAVLLFNHDSLIIRTNFYGWGTSYRKSFSDQIIQSLRSFQELYLFDDVYYTPILMQNLIQTVHELIERKAKGIFNIASDDRISKYEFGILIAEEFGLDKSLIVKSSIISQPNLVKRPADMSLSNRKVCELLGKNLGKVNEHVSILHQQESHQRTREIQLL